VKRRQPQVLREKKCRPSSYRFRLVAVLICRSRLSFSRLDQRAKKKMAMPTTRRTRAVNSIITKKIPSWSTEVGNKLAQTVGPTYPVYRSRQLR
jgi:hypothetical protein